MKLRGKVLAIPVRKIAFGSIALAALAAAGCATNDGGDPSPPSDRSAQDFEEDECPECVPPGTAPVSVEESE